MHLQAASESKAELEAGKVLGKAGPDTTCSLTALSSEKADENTLETDDHAANLRLTGIKSDTQVPDSDGNALGRRSSRIQRTESPSVSTTQKTLVRCG